MAIGPAPAFRPTEEGRLLGHVHVQRPLTVLQAVLPPHDDVIKQWSTQEGEQATQAARDLFAESELAEAKAALRALLGAGARRPLDADDRGLAEVGRDAVLALELDQVAEERLELTNAPVETIDLVVALEARRRDRVAEARERVKVRRALAIDAQNPSTLYFAARLSTFVPRLEYVTQIYKTTDGGLNWVTEPVEPGSEARWQHPPFSGAIADGSPVRGMTKLPDSTPSIGPRKG